jgi:hypothetical protein
MKVKITKLKELEDAYHPNNIEEGYTIIKETFSEYFREPVIGESFWIGSFGTSVVTEILSENTFKTLNSIYQWEIL